MQNLIRFLIKYHFLILFIFIEGIAIVLLLNNNNYQQTKFVDFTRAVSGSFHQQMIKINDYLVLRKKNEKLVEENTRLRNLLEKQLDTRDNRYQSFTDSTATQQYEFINAKIINNSVNKQHNYITLNRGKADGIRSEMGVISRDGVIGVVRGVSEHYSTVISLLNSELRISSKLKKSGYFGPLSWDGRNYRYAYLREIPLNAQLHKGDSIVTSGYSTIFPENILVGYIDEFEEKGGSFYEITVELSVDFKAISEVYIIRNLQKKEQKELENNRLKND